MCVIFRYYQVRCSLRVSPRLSAIQIETSVLENLNKELSSATVIRGAGTSKIFQILYRNEEVILRDTVIFRVRLPGNQLLLFVSAILIYKIKKKIVAAKKSTLQKKTCIKHEFQSVLSYFFFLHVLFSLSVFLCLPFHKFAVVRIVPVCLSLTSKNTIIKH